MNNDRFTNQKRRVATEEECHAPWGGLKNGAGFRCYLCGHRFRPGDGWRWVYTGSRNFQTPEGKTFGVINFKTCDACDGPTVIDRWIARNIEFSSDRFWALR